MDTRSLAARPTRRLPSEPSPRKPRSGNLRAWLRSRVRRIVTLSVVLLVGIVVGIVSTILFALSIGGSRPMLSNPSQTQSGDIVIQVGIAYITHLVAKDLQASGMVNASNVQVTMVQGDLMNINGDDDIAFGITRPFTIVVQPLVHNCQLQMHIVSANLAGIPVTSLVANFEGRINQELQSKSGTLPSGFIYCKTSVRTDPQNGLFITFSAKPV